jgi:hypothetical protein
MANPVPLEVFRERRFPLAMRKGVSETLALRGLCAEGCGWQE